MCDLLHGTRPARRPALFAAARALAALSAAQAVLAVASMAELPCHDAAAS
jgi:hypothetical protein